MRPFARHGHEQLYFAIERKNRLRASNANLFQSFQLKKDTDTQLQKSLRFTAVLDKSNYKSHAMTAPMAFRHEIWSALLLVAHYHFLFKDIYL